jgi:hypothetical protein
MEGKIKTNLEGVGFEDVVWTYLTYNMEQLQVNVIINLRVPQKQVKQL